MKVRCPACLNVSTPFEPDQSEFMCPGCGQKLRIPQPRAASDSENAPAALPAPAVVSVQVDEPNVGQIGSQTLPEPSLASRWPAAVPMGACSLALLVGASSPPYDYYAFLRWFVCATAVVLGIHALRIGAMQWLPLAAGMLVAYWPNSVFSLAHSTWNAIDVVLAALLALAGLMLVPPRSNDDTDGKLEAWPWWGIPLAVYGCIGLTVWISLSSDGGGAAVPQDQECGYYAPTGC